MSNGNKFIWDKVYKQAIIIIDIINFIKMSYQNGGGYNYGI